LGLRQEQMQLVKKTILINNCNRITALEIKSNLVEAEMEQPSPEIRVSGRQIIWKKYPSTLFV
jgi:hypothetical protein